MVMSKLAAKNAVVTGASRGLGQAIAYKLGNLGCSVTLVAKNRKRLEDSLENVPIVNKYQTHKLIDFDLERLGSGEKHQENHDELVRSLESSSILVNCAGITSHRLLSRMSEQEISSMINLNLVAPIFLSKLSCMPMMRLASKKSSDSTVESKFKPVIINVSSVLSITEHTIPGTSVYAATKAGLLGFSKSLASELRGKVRVNSIMPGLIQETDMGSKVSIDGLKTVTLEKVVDKTIDIITNESINGECHIIDDM